MKTYFGFLALAVVATGCSSGLPPAARDFDDPAVVRLFAQPIPEYYANLRLAQRIAASCDRYRFDQSLDLDISEQRQKEGRGSVAALRHRSSIDAMTDIRTREFRAKYGVAPGEGDVCGAADQEVAQNTALSAVLVPES
ncbi:MAG: hypothetical protein ABJQ34_16380 [Paracoccaceae bacterium]